MSRRSALAFGALAAASVVSACSRDSDRQGTSPTAAPGSPTEGSSRTAVVEPPSTPVSGSTPSPASGGTRAGAPAREVSHGSRSRDLVALTFHGAGDPAIARDLLTILAAHRAHVTVLAVGTWLAADHAIAEEIVRGGHELGNHTYRHLDIDSLGAAAARQEIRRCRDLLVAQVGSPGAHFRPSQTRQASALVKRLAGSEGYPVCLSYDVDSLDYTDPGPDAVRRNLATARAGSIVSMHFGHTGTVTAMPGILDDLAARGLGAVTAATLLGP